MRLCCRLLRRSGCQWIVIGLESVSPAGLGAVDPLRFKSRYVESYREKIAAIQDSGIGVYGTFIVGLDQDDKGIFEATSRFILENRLYGANVTVPTPLPGTELRLFLEREGRILCNDWAFYTLWDVVIQPKQMTAEELEKGLLDVYLSISDSASADSKLREMLKAMRFSRKETRTDDGRTESVSHERQSFGN